MTNRQSIILTEVNIMGIFDIIIINTILILFSLFVYLFYIAKSSIIDKQKSDITLELAIFSSFYLIIKYGVGIIGDMPLFIMNIPLVFMYIKKRSIGGIILSFLIIFYYNQIIGWNVFLLMLEYFIYFVIYKTTAKINTRFNEIYFVFIFVILKTLNFKINLIINSYLNTNLLTSNYNIILAVFELLASSFIALYMLNTATSIVKIYSSFAELQKEKQLRTSLFKITHEIKNPIAVCKGYLDMFDVNNKDHAIRYIPILKEEIARVLLLLTDFLSVNKLKIEKDVLDINLLLEESLDTFELLFKEKHIKSVVDIKDEELFVSGDYNRLNQVIINVIKNSIEAIDERGGVIKIKVDEICDGVNIIIHDNGVGMNEEVLNKFKEPFYTTKKGGSGLGVSLSYEIIEAHNGKIKYDSKEGFGTKVTITLPKLKKSY